MKICYIAGSLETGLKPDIKEGDYLIAADGGFLLTEKWNRKPDLVVGDFDSLGYIPKSQNIVKHPVEKDDTDMLLAVKLGMKAGYKEFRIYGGIGGRLDHTVANCQTLAYLKENHCNGILYGESETVFMLKEETLEIKGRKGQRISVFAFGGKAEGVTLKNLYYPLQDAVMTTTFPIGVSNEFPDGETLDAVATIGVNRGSLLVIQES